MDSATRRLVAELAHRHARERRGLHVFEGVAPFLHACWSGVEILGIVHSPVLLQSVPAQKTVRAKRREGVPVHKVSPEAFRSLSRSSRASGVLAVARQPWRPLDDVDPERGLGRLVIERIRSQGNLGTILRTADAAGIAGVVFLGDATDPYDPATIRASMGSLYRLELTRASVPELAAWARRRDVRVVGTSPTASQSYRAITPHPRPAIVLGDERSGMSDEAASLCDECVAIPNQGHVDSLNVAVAAGVVLFELLARVSPAPAVAREA